MGGLRLDMELVVPSYSEATQAAGLALNQRWSHKGLPREGQ